MFFFFFCDFVNFSCLSVYFYSLVARLCLGYLCISSAVMFVSPCSFPTCDRPLHLVVGGSGEDACRDAAHQGQVSCEEKAEKKVM